MTVLAQGDGALPDWAGDLPPWATVVVAIVVGGPTLLGALVGVIGAVNTLRRRRESAPDGTDNPPAPTTPELRQASSEMDRMLALLEESQRQDHAQINALEAQLARMQEQLRDRDQTIALLRQTLDQVLGRPREAP